MTVPIYAEYKAMFNVVLVNIHLPFQHKQEIQTVRGSLFFCFHMGKLKPYRGESGAPELIGVNRKRPVTHLKGIKVVPPRK